MQHIPEIMKIIEAGLQEDSMKVYNYSNLLIENLIKETDTNSADKLKKVIKNSKTFTLKLRDKVTLKNLPVDSESRLSLAEVEYYSEKEVFLSVTEDVLNNLEEYIDLINKAEKIDEKTGKPKGLTKEIKGKAFGMFLGALKTEEPGHP